MIFENISENALSNNIIGQYAQCVQCVIEINPLKDDYLLNMMKLFKLRYIFMISIGRASDE